MKKISIYLIISIFIILPVFVNSQGSSPPTPLTPSPVFTIPNPLKCPVPEDCSTLIGLLTALLNNVVMPIAAVAVVMWIIWAGFAYVTAQGNPTKIQKAHQQLMWSLIGAGILLGAAGISLVVQNTITALIR